MLESSERILGAVLAVIACLDAGDTRLARQIAEMAMDDLAASAAVLGALYGEDEAAIARRAKVRMIEWIRSARAAMGEEVSDE